MGALAAALACTIIPTAAMAGMPPRVAGSATARDWPMFRGNPQLTGVSPGPLPEHLKVRWKVEMPEAIGSSAAVVGGVVYVGCDDGFLYALDLSTGKERWKYEAKEMIRSSPTVVGGVVFFGDDIGKMHAVDAATGKRKWTFETEGQIISAANPTAGRIVFGSYDGFVYCLSMKDGSLIWKFETEGRVHATPGLAGENVVAAGCDEYLHVIRLSDGTSVSKTPMGSVCGASAAVRAGRTFIGTYGAQVLGIEWKSATTAWTFQDPDREFPYMSSAAVTDRVVVLGSRDKRLRALDIKTGKLRWTFRTKGRIDASPVIVGNRVFVGSGDGNLYAVDVESGKETWRFESAAPITASPAVAAGTLVIANEDGIVYCFAGK